MKTKTTCPDCEGEGITFASNCCGAPPKSNGDCDTSDFGICSECGDHCDYDLECETCNGTGELFSIPLPKTQTKK